MNRWYCASNERCVRRVDGEMRYFPANMGARQRDGNTSNGVRTACSVHDQVLGSAVRTSNGDSLPAVRGAHRSTSNADESAEDGPETLAGRAERPMVPSTRLRKTTPGTPSQHQVRNNAQAPVVRTSSR